MNVRLIKFVSALSLCLFGSYFLVADLLSGEILLERLGVQFSQPIGALLCLGGIVGGVLLTRRAIIEELSVTSD